jgi:protein-S-isoprenylcysteine O-methyltransferase Ste14
MKKLTLIKVFIILGNIGVPASAIFLSAAFPGKSYRWIFVIFILFHSFERVWETFYTSRERKPHEFHGDWTLATVTATYIGLCFFVIFEFFFANRSINMILTAVGCIFYVSAFRMRWWGMASLGTQWSIHAVGAIKLKRYRLLNIGAYKYVRHPVYLGIILEELGLPLIANAWVAFFYSIIICIPLVFVRAMVEEKSSQRKFGQKYLDYKKRVSMLLPLKTLGRFLSNESR